MTTQEPTVAAFPFPTLASAQRAYDALRERGLTREQMELRVMDDEAGPSSGNFILDNLNAAPAGRFLFVSWKILQLQLSFGPTMSSQ